MLEWDDARGRIAWSPDGRWLAVSSVNGVTSGSVEKGIVLVSPTTGERIDWTSLDRAFSGSYEPAFSPDGTRIAFTRTIGSFTGQLDIVGVGRDGKPVGQPTVLAYEGQEAHSPVWTADGRSGLVIEGSPTSNGGIARIPVDQPDNAERLAGLDHAATMALSRDGTRLIFSRGGNNADIWRVDLQDPSRSGRIATSTLWDEGAAYSPDGRRIAFSSNRGGGREIWVADVSGDNAQRSWHSPPPTASTCTTSAARAPVRSTRFVRTAVVTRRSSRS